MMVDLYDADDEVAAALQAGAARAQKFARAAILRFVQSEAKARPDDHGAILITAMQAGFLMSLIEAGAVAKGNHKRLFLNLAESVYDEVMDRKARRKPKRGLA